MSGHQVVMVLLERNLDENLQRLVGMCGEVGGELVHLLVVGDYGQQVKQFGCLKQALEILSEGGFGHQTQAELVFKDAVKAVSGRVEELGDTFH